MWVSLYTITKSFKTQFPLPNQSQTRRQFLLHKHLWVLALQLTGKVNNSWVQSRKLRPIPLQQAARLLSRTLKHSLQQERVSHFIIIKILLYRTLMWLIQRGSKCKRLRFAKGQNRGFTVHPAGTYTAWNCSINVKIKKLILSKRKDFVTLLLKDCTIPLFEGERAFAQKTIF